MGDVAYSVPDEYVGEGTGWMDHWGITRGQPPLGEPSFPQWVIDKSREIHRKLARRRRQRRNREFAEQQLKFG